MCNETYELPDVKYLNFITCQFQTSPEKPNVSGLLALTFKYSHSIVVRGSEGINFSLSVPDGDTNLRVFHTTTIDILDALTSVGKPCLQLLHFQTVTLTDDVLRLLKIRGLLNAVKFTRCRFYEGEGCHLPVIVEHLNRIIPPIFRIVISEGFTILSENVTLYGWDTVEVFEQLLCFDTLLIFPLILSTTFPIKFF